MAERRPPEPNRPQFTLSAQEMKLLAQRFGHGSVHPPQSVVGLTDDRMRQLAEHFTP